MGDIHCVIDFDGLIGSYVDLILSTFVYAYILEKHKGAQHFSLSLKTRLVRAFVRSWCGRGARPDIVRVFRILASFQRRGGIQQVVLLTQGRAPWKGSLLAQAQTSPQRLIVEELLRRGGLSPSLFDRYVFTEGKKKDLRAVMRKPEDRFFILDDLPFTSNYEPFPETQFEHLHLEPYSLPFPKEEEVCKSMWAHLRAVHIELSQGDQEWTRRQISQLWSKYSGLYGPTL